MNRSEKISRWCAPLNLCPAKGRAPRHLPQYPKGCKTSMDSVFLSVNPLFKAKTLWKGVEESSEQSLAVYLRQAGEGQ